MVFRKCLFLMVVLAVLGSAPAQSVLILDDPLQGSTSGVRSGGSFVTGGWKVTGKNDSIFWHLPYRASNGIAEFDVKGLNPNESRAGMTDRSELFHMYDWYGLTVDADVNYNGGYRDVYQKMFIVKNGSDYAPYGLVDTVKTLWQIWPEWQEPYTYLTWNAASTYRFRIEWGQVGSSSVCRDYRDGVLLKSMTVAGVWNPLGHSVRIAASPRRDAYSGAPIDAVFSNLKVWDGSATAPETPTVTRPLNGGTISSMTPLVQWTGTNYTKYRVLVNTANDPDSGIAWDSGEITSTALYTYTGTLNDLTDYYVFVRLGNTVGWSTWSAGGHWFRVDTSQTQSGGKVRLLGNSTEDDGGPFLALGASYFQAMRRCKYDRARFRSDLSFLSQQGIKYIRTLSMVGWYEAWLGKEIAPLGFTGRAGVYVPAWPDYWQQFRDCIDIAYDEYGIRTELTIFADAQLMPNKSDRINHMQQVLNNLVGREHKIMHLEVCNEAWQNGFPDAQGTADLREFAKYLTDRTDLLVAISDSVGTDNASIEALYQGSTATLCTEHISRDISTVEGGWLPVRNCWDFEFMTGVPPVSSNEPIGPGSSVASENDPIKLVSAAAFAWIAKLPMYVFHSEAGVFGISAFENMAGARDYIHLFNILPPDLPNWTRNDGREAGAPFTAYANGQANKWWTEVSNPATGAIRNIGSRKGNEFVTLPIGIRSGGLTLEARETVTFRVFNPLSGEIVMDVTTKAVGESFTLPQGPGAYIIRGVFGTDLPIGRTLNVKPAGAITIDGDTSDWNLSEFSGYIRGGGNGSGDIALAGFDEGSLYYGGYWTGGVLPTSAADHTAKICSRHDSTYQYFLVRCDDSDIRYPNGTSMNWANDCVEFYIDPDNDGGTTPLGDSTSDVQLVIDANNQKNVYGCTSGYAAQVLGGVTSAVVRDTSGWRLEVRIRKDVFSPAIPADGAIGVDFNFRDNDNNNDAAQTTVYAWSDSASGAGFPSKVPARWGDALLADTTPPGPVTGFSAAASDGEAILSWTNPSNSDFSKTTIRCSTTSYPATPEDGTAVVDKSGSPGAGESYTHTGLSNGTTYYYSAFACDKSSNYSSAASASARPVAIARVTINGSAFTSGLDGWTTSVWKLHQDYGYGTMTWNGTYGNPGGCMRSTGAGDTDNDATYIREGGEIRKVIPTTGYMDIKVSYQLRVGSLGGDFTGTGTHGYPVDHGLIDEQLTVFYSTNGGSTWTEADWIKRDGLLSGYQSYGTRQINLSGISGVENNPSFALRFRWQFNSKPELGDYADLDNIIVTGVVPDTGSISDAKKLQDGELVSLVEKGLYLKEGTFGYIEEPDLSSGIRIQGTISASEGHIVSIAGKMRTTAGGERYIELEGISSGGALAIKPVGTNNRAAKEALTDGLFVTAWGKVKAGSVTGNSFIITDGAEDAGIRVITAGATVVTEGSFVTVTGAAGFDGGRVIYSKQ